MQSNKQEVIEAEVVEDFSTQGAKRATLGESEPLRPTVIRANQPPSWHTPGDHARPQGDLGGMLGGFLTLAVGILVTLCVMLVGICIILPFTLLLRTLGVHKHT